MVASVSSEIHKNHASGAHLYTQMTDKCDNSDYEIVFMCFATGFASGITAKVLLSSATDD